MTQALSQPAGIDKMDVDLKGSASLLGSRICHDLISPLGAISNGLELLAMSGMGKSPELKLVEEAIASANARVRFFRVAFGASTGSQVMARSEIMALIEDCYGTGRIKLRWDVAHDPTRTEAKIALLCVLCLESALPAGGEVVVSSDRGAWSLQAYGSKIRFQKELWSGLNGHEPIDATSGQVQFLLLREALLQTGASPQIGHSDSAVSLRF